MGGEEEGNEIDQKGVAVDKRGDLLVLFSTCRVTSHGPSGPPERGALRERENKIIKLKK